MLLVPSYQAVSDLVSDPVLSLGFWSDMSSYQRVEYQLNMAIPKFESL